MEHQGPNNPSQAVNYCTDPYDPGWREPQYVYYSDDSRSWCPLGLNDQSCYLKATNFGFSIPDGSEIKGIKVEIEKQSGPGTIKDYSVKLVKNGSIVGNDKAKTTDSWPDLDAYFSYGGQSDTWGVNWAPEEINASGFGVVISAEGFDESCNAKIDHVRITIYYIPVEQRSTQGYKDPGTVENDNSVGTEAWSNLDNCKASDDAYTSAVLSAGEISNYLKAINFGFQIADDAVIKGIKVLIEKKASAADKIKDYEIKLVKGGVVQNENKAETEYWSIYDGYSEYGSKSDLWGLSWIPDDINSADFGVVIAVKNEGSGNYTAYINHICIAVYYQYTTPPISEAFKELMEQPGSEKIYLVEMKPAVEMKDWLHYGDGIYYQLWTEKHINVIPKIVKVEENGVELTEEASFANMQANPGSWYLEGEIETLWDDGETDWDAGETLWGSWPQLYVHSSDEGDANEKTIIVYIQLNFASKPKIFNSQYYFPRLKKEGVPAIGTESKDIFSFETSVGGGSIRLLNGDRFFDELYRRYLWKNKEVKILVGGEDLKYTEYRTQFVGKIQNSSFSDREVEYALRDVRVDLHKKLPLNKYYTADYPNMDPDAEGNPIPLIWGHVKNVPATLIDSTSQKGKYKIADHANSLGNTLKVINEVYDNGTPINVGDLSKDLVKGEFTILNSYTGTPGTITCEVRGRKDDDEGSITGYADSLIIKASDIIKDICKNLLGLEKLNNDDFELSRIEAPQELAIYLGDEEYSNKVIEKICQSGMGHFVIAANGFIHFSIWSDDVPEDIIWLKEEDILSFQESCEIEEIFWKVVVKYDEDPGGDYKAVQVSDDTVKYKFDRAIEKEVETYLNQSNDAENLAANIIAKANSEKGKYEVETKLKAIELKVGDKVKISRSRAPANEGKFEGKVFRVLGISKDISKMRTRLILMED